ncbi:P-loop containing nucleoside triphosphate hydrolase protein [Exidia glandulosa HHB12029]|uniref:Guanine nucleotide-binding protein-like 1 n=1 Tax=Exidia glandulosa HHB12029 TaxID=1314781 RepID=A0A165CUE7_EXIGL|nr:P-loop containing nucleoside triphosphate hydrolase protein [Exidia glandulosa HHB12029]
MPRRKPQSAKAKKLELQHARAVKRGDEPAPPPLKPGQKRGPVTRRGGAPAPATSASAAAVRKLESAFVRLDNDLLAQAKLRASENALVRPIPRDLALPPPEVLESQGKPLVCPKRPKWHYEDTKKMVEANEEALFKKWLSETDTALHRWLHPPPANAEDPDSVSGSTSAAKEWGPSYYERNIEVWRQLWRVTEISDILVVLLDSRLPPLHFPPSLQSFLSTVKPPRKIILVLTKADITGPEHCAAWSRWLENRHPGVRVVTVESYRPKPMAQGTGRHRVESHIPPQSMQQFVDALKATYAELTTPPEAIRHDPAKVAAWKPRVKEHVEWDVLMQPQDQRASVPRRSDDQEPEDDEEKRYLTLGLIGQPNVGKSSLLNALFGEHKVKASRTPGKTKHFQTLFWTPEIRLCDCPGLVMPNYTHLELQVLCGILPIARIPSLPSCVHYTAQRLPLEKILNLSHPSGATPASEDKRTWRPEQLARRATQGSTEREWTAMDIMTAFAERNGWMTAKAGRPDVMRAGNALMRALAEGRIKWAFRPPGDDTETETGIWIAEPQAKDEEVWDDGESDGEEGDDASETDSTEKSTPDSEEEEKPAKTFTAGRFGALVEDNDDDDEGDDSEESSDQG